MKIALKSLAFLLIINGACTFTIGDDPSPASSGGNNSGSCKSTVSRTSTKVTYVGINSTDVVSLLGKFTGWSTNSSLTSTDGIKPKVSANQLCPRDLFISLAVEMAWNAENSYRLCDTSGALTYAESMKEQLTQADQFCTSTSGCLTLSLIPCGSGTVGTGSALISFTNNTFTVISITLITGTQNNTLTINPGASVNFNGTAGATASMTAETFGKTTSGTQVGEKISWSLTYTFTTAAQTINLNITSTYFFARLKNSTAQEYERFYVNFGLTSQTFDNITLPAFSGLGTATTYGIGYYKAFSNSNARIYKKGSTTEFYSWPSITFPATNNQFILFEIK